MEQRDLLQDHCLLFTFSFKIVQVLKKKNAFTQYHKSYPKDYSVNEFLKYLYIFECNNVKIFVVGIQIFFFATYMVF